MNKAIKLLGELALRVNDMDRMRAFYRDVVGLDVMAELPEGVFFHVAEAVRGHPQFLALFDRDTEVGPERTTVDHFAFLIDLADYDSERQRLEAVGVSVFTKIFPLPKWRALFFSDPEGNTVEFVCYDESISGDTASPSTD